MRESLRDFFLALSYARREMRSGFRGFYVFLACLVLGVGAIASVQSLSRGMIDSLRYDGRYILGGDIALRTIYAPATKEQLDFLRHIGPVTTVVETRAMARSEDGAKSSLTELKAVDPFYPLYGFLTLTNENGIPLAEKLQNLLFPPETDSGGWGAVVEKEFLSRLSLKIGDHFFVGKQKFQVRGIIVKEPDRIGNLHFSIAPRVMISSAVFDQTGLGAQGNLVYFDHRVIARLAQTPAEMDAAAKKITDRFPAAPWKGRHAFNASPQIERMVGKLTLFLTLIGLTTLLVGGVGISNAIRSFLDGRLSHIATFKCLGASAPFVFRVYMMQILALAAFGILLGLLAGLLVSQSAGALLTAKLTLSNKVGVYPQALALAAGFGFLTTFCFSLWPLGRALNTSPADLFRDLIVQGEEKPSRDILLWLLIAAQALALLTILSTTQPRLAVWFIVFAGATFTLFYLYAAGIKAGIKKIRFPVRPEWRMAVANLHRPGNVSSSIILSLGLGLTVLTAITLIENNFSRLLKSDLTGDTPSFFFLDIQPGQKESFEKLVARDHDGKNLKVIASFRGRIISVNGVPAEKALVDKDESWVISSDRGFTSMADMPAHSRITEGKWWDKNYQGPPVISIATDVAHAFNIGLGAELTVNILGKEIASKVVNVREIDWGSFTMNFAVTFSPGALNGIPGNFIGTAVVPADRESETQNAVARDFPNVTTVRVKDALDAAQTIVRAVAQAVRVSAAVTLLAGTLVLAGGIAAARRGHIYDAVILKVLGASQARIMKTFLLEYALLGCLTVIIAGALGTLASYAAITHLMEMDWTFSIRPLAVVTLLCLLLTLSAGGIGTLHALRQKPAAFLRNK